MRSKSPKKPEKHKIKKGIVAVYKPVGISSYDVIRKLKKIFPNEKIGHGGTLDPLAEGVLVIGIGNEATSKLHEVLKDTNKRYIATIMLGRVSETDDSEGPIKKANPNSIKPTQDQILHTCLKFLGSIKQIPPKYSAIKIKGQPAYKRARRGEEIDLKPREVEIHAISIMKYEFPEVILEITCSSGTYIRSLARDIGKELGTGAYLRALKRAAVGNYSEKDAIFL